jgi:Protein of unknown function, DUF547
MLSRLTLPMDAIQSYGDLLAKYVAVGKDGVARAAYAKWHGSQPDRDKLASVIAAFAAQEPSVLSRNEAFAFWANLYNALTLQVVLDAYPVKSIRNIKSRGTSFFDWKSYIGPWRTKLVTVEGRELSLDGIEHAILRPTFKDPRVHYAVNCASVGCPNLQATPWNEATLDASLDRAAGAYVNHPRGVSVARNGKITVSSIYSWFKEDFGGNQAGVISHLLKYASPELGAKLMRAGRIGGNRYDWSLNGAE